MKKKNKKWIIHRKLIVPTSVVFSYSQIQYSSALDPLNLPYSNTAVYTCVYGTCTYGVCTRYGAVCVYGLLTVWPTDVRGLLGVAQGPGYRATARF